VPRKWVTLNFAIQSFILLEDANENPTEDDDEVEHNASSGPAVNLTDPDNPVRPDNVLLDPADIRALTYGVKVCTLADYLESLGGLHYAHLCAFSSSAPTPLSSAQDSTLHVLPTGYEGLREGIF
jgi:hypothetical protein